MNLRKVYLNVGQNNRAKVIKFLEDNVTNPEKKPSGLPKVDFYSSRFYLVFQDDSVDSWYIGRGLETISGAREKATLKSIVNHVTKGDVKKPTPPKLVKEVITKTYRKDVLGLAKELVLEANKQGFNVSINGPVISFSYDFDA